MSDASQRDAVVAMLARRSTADESYESAYRDWTAVLKSSADREYTADGDPGKTGWKFTAVPAGAWTSFEITSPNTGLKYVGPFLPDSIGPGATLVLPFELANKSLGPGQDPRITTLEAVRLLEPVNGPELQRLARAELERERSKVNNRDIAIDRDGRSYRPKKPGIFANESPYYTFDPGFDNPFKR